MHLSYNKIGYTFGHKYLSKVQGDKKNMLKSFKNRYIW